MGPSDMPSKSPSTSPTPKPSDAPYKIGTPSRDPSQSTMSPSEYPSITPSGFPSYSPSSIPSNLPSISPSAFTYSPTTQLPTTSTPTLIQSVNNGISGQVASNDASLLNVTVGVIIGALVSCVLMMGCVICMLYKRRDAKRKEQIHIQMGNSDDYHATMSQSEYASDHRRVDSKASNYNVAETQVIVSKVPDVVVHNIVPPAPPHGVAPRSKKIKSIVVEAPGAAKNHGSSRKNTESDSHMYGTQTLGGDKMTLIGYDDMITADGNVDDGDVVTSGFIGDGSMTQTPGNTNSMLGGQAGKTINAFKLRQLRESMAVAEVKPLPNTFNEHEGIGTSAQEVAGWLNSIGMDAYYNSFVKSGFNTMNFIKQINDMSYLAMLDPPINNLAHRILIFRNIQAMTEDVADV